MNPFTQEQIKNKFLELTNCQSELAQEILDLNNYNLEAAVQTFNNCKNKKYQNIFSKYDAVKQYSEDNNISFEEAKLKITNNPQNYKNYSSNQTNISQFNQNSINAQQNQYLQPQQQQLQINDCNNSTNQVKIQQFTPNSVNPIQNQYFPYQQLQIPNQPVSNNTLQNTSYNSQISFRPQVQNNQQIYQQAPNITLQHASMQYNSMNNSYFTAQNGMSTLDATNTHNTTYESTISEPPGTNTNTNDSLSQEIRNQFKTLAAQQGLRCIVIPQTQNQQLEQVQYVANRLKAQIAEQNIQGTIWYIILIPNQERIDLQIIQKLLEFQKILIYFFVD
ncbi:UBA-like_superfamily [Hexamita inflata]|uniref:UBA-like superfamily n=1 Tax=Hexamita inflata TaxID=28002 RepID=A0AA86PK40_9EUKA|nr:UBA-like superfamily [Hexamita inflata]